jgi:hypothetical protein
MLQTIKPEDTEHILEVLPHFWPKVVQFCEEAASSPGRVVTGELCMLLDEVERQHKTPRAARAELDMERIRRSCAGDELVERMLVAAFQKMADGVRNHASEFLSGGRLCIENITPELMEELDGCRTTSTSVERGFAIGRLHDRIKGVCRADGRAGWCQSKMDNTTGWMRTHGHDEQVT